MSRTRSEWPDPPKPGDEIACTFTGRLIKGCISSVYATSKTIYVLVPDDDTPMLFFSSEEGTKWARGWDPETVGALLAANALLEPAA